MSQVSFPSSLKWNVCSGHCSERDTQWLAQRAVSAQHRVSSSSEKLAPQLPKETKVTFSFLPPNGPSQEDERHQSEVDTTSFTAVSLNSKTWWARRSSPTQNRMKVSGAFHAHRHGACSRQGKDLPSSLLWAPRWPVSTSSSGSAAWDPHFGTSSFQHENQKFLGY